MQDRIEICHEIENLPEAVRTRFLDGFAVKPPGGWAAPPKNPDSRLTHNQTCAIFPPLSIGFVAFCGSINRHNSMRDNQEWVQQLRGDRGGQQQAAAHRDLSSYLYVVAYNYLRLRQADLRALDAFPAEDLAALAQDFVQETLEKLARRD